MSTSLFQRPDLSAPWHIFLREIEAMFDNDPEIEVTGNVDGDDKEIQLLVTNASKADALTKLLPTEKTFGNVTVKISVVPANDMDSPISLIQRAFDGNPVFSYAMDVEGPEGFNATYAVFAKEVVQFFTDNIGDINGYTSTLYQDIANDIFEDHEGVFFCTDDVNEYEEAVYRLRSLLDDDDDDWDD